MATKIQIRCSSSRLRVLFRCAFCLSARPIMTDKSDLKITQCDNEIESTPRLESSDSLEKSWKSLQAFNQSQFGRIDSMQTDEEQINQNGTTRVEELLKFGDGFQIPELPIGATLRFKLLSTWGDPYYVGLNGIEIFDSNGLPAKIERITADPKDMTVVPKFVDDPRTIENLVDGVYATKDDAHLWLAPFRGARSNYIFIDFQGSTQIAMIRIWNYNKSRIHSYRGVRHLEISLDDQIVFKGELAKGPGTCCAQTEELSDTILFTTDEIILEKLAENDSHLFGECPVEKNGPPNSTEAGLEKRPSTGCSQAAKPLAKKKPEEPSSILTSMISVEGDQMVMKGKRFVLELVQNWGAPDVIGLTGVQLLDRYGRPCVLASQMLSCNQKKCDSLQRLLNDKNFTTDKKDMWLCKFEHHSSIKITIRFPQSVAILGLRIWNYNQSFEFSYAGVQTLNFYVEDDLILQNVPIVKAPGNLHYKFSQDVLFGLIQPMSLPKVSDDLEWGVGIRGFVFQLQLLSTWGDEFYVGLNGVELFDGANTPMKLTNRNIAAYPESVNILPNVCNDVRTIDKLIDGVNETDNVKHMWLTPILPHTLNRLYFIFDKPTTVSSIVVWNYTRTPSRGVQNVVILVDDAIVHSCEIAQSLSNKTISTKISLI